MFWGFEGRLSEEECGFLAKDLTIKDVEEIVRSARKSRMLGKDSIC